MGHPPSHVSAYSSDSEDSGTEEYKQVEHRYLFNKISNLQVFFDINIYDFNYPFGWGDSINPVTGSYEPQRPNPLEHMTEEQKEYEAVKLVNMIDQLQRCAAKSFYEFALETNVY